MAVIEWTDKVWQLYNEYLENARYEYMVLFTSQNKRCLGDVIS